MSNEVVKYNNEMNNIAFKSFNATELDLFFTICSKVRNEEVKEVRYSFDELKELTKYSKRNNRLFAQLVTSTYEKMLKLVYRIDTETEAIYFTLFNLFAVNETQEYVRIKVNEDFRYILSNITSNFTRFELDTFTTLKSTYSKTMYRLLKQFKSTGYYKVHINEFRKLLDIPKSYRMTDINRQVLNPIEKELPAHFKNLEIKKEKAKKGNKIEYIVFTFDKERAVKKQATIEYEIANSDVEVTQDEFEDLMNELKRDKS